MKRINIEYLKNEDYVDYIDSDLFLIENGEKLTKIKIGTVEVEAIIVVFCLSGAGKVTMNGTTHQLSSNQLILGMSHTVYSNYMKLTDDFQVKIIGISTRALNSSVFMTKNIWKDFYFLLNNPVLDIDKNDIQLFSQYYELANLKIHKERSPFHKAIMMSLVHAVIFELLAIINKVESMDFHEDDPSSQSDLLFKNFLELLAEHEGRIRSVQDYADMLCVTPKYLSQVVKQVSGRTAISIIHETTVHSIVRQLKYTDKPIKEISDSMGFPSATFFGKFVKKYLGVPPKKFRDGK